MRNSKFDNKRFFYMFLVLMVALNIDSIIGSMVDILHDFTVSVPGLALFITISLLYGVCQYFIFRMIKSKNKEKEIRKEHFNVLEKIVTVAQYALLAILVLVILQVVFNSGYLTVLLRVAVMISSGLALYVVGFLSYSLFTWFKANRALVVLLYGLASATITIYIISVAVIFDMALQEKTELITPQTEIIFSSIPSGRIDNQLNTLQTYSSIAFFFLIWIGNILLLYQNIHRIGKTKFWLLMSTPLVAWSIFFLLFYQSIVEFLPGEDPIMSIVIPLLLIATSQIAALVLIGMTFVSIAKALSHTLIIRDYMMITAYGFMLFFTTTTATISGAGYPPFGIVNVMLLGTFAFLILNGLYRSAICAAEDTELRRSIKVLAKRESKLLDVGATTENLNDIVSRVMTTVRVNAKKLEEDSGIEPSLTQEDMKDYTNQVIQELVRRKLRK